MSKFKAGDVVIRINDSWGACVLGGEYIVDYMNVSYEELFLRGHDKGYDPSNFVLKKQDTTKEEAEIVKAWLNKLYWLCLSTDIVGTDVKVITEDGYELFGKASVDFVINSYEAYQSKAKQKAKQELLDKKAKLELELAQINEQLGE